MNKQELIEAIKQLQIKIDFYELDPDDYIEEYDNMLDELGTVTIGSLEYSPSEVLKTVDPIAYRCGLGDYVDNIDSNDVGEYIEMCSDLEDLEYELYQLEEEEEEENLTQT